MIRLIKAYGVNFTEVVAAVRPPTGCSRKSTRRALILDVVVIGKKAFEALSDEEREKLIKEAQPLRDEIIAAGRPRFS